MVKNKQKLIRFLIPYLFVAPILIFLVTFRIYPIASAFYYSMFKWDLFGSLKYVGFGNFIRLVNDRKFITALYNTFYFVLGSCPPRWVIALLFAFILNRTFRGRKWFRLVYFIPVTISIAVMAIMMKFIYHPTFGLFSYVTGIFGFHTNWLMDSTLAMPAIILAIIWMSTPLYIVVYLAALQDIPDMFYEAACIDGANKWRQFWHLTLPLLKPAHTFVIIMSVLASIRIFVPFFVITQGGPSGATRVLSLYSYQNLFRYRKVGYANAISVAIFLISLALSLIFLKVLKTREKT